MLPLQPDPLGLSPIPNVAAHPYLEAQNILEQLTALSTRQLIPSLEPRHMCPLHNLTELTRKLVAFLGGKSTLIGAIILLLSVLQACTGIFMTSR